MIYSKESKDSYISSLTPYLYNVWLYCNKIGSHICVYCVNDSFKNNLLQRGLYSQIAYFVHCY